MLIFSGIYIFFPVNSFVDILYLCSLQLLFHKRFFHTIIINSLSLLLIFLLCLMTDFLKDIFHTSFFKCMQSILLFFSLLASGFELFYTKVFPRLQKDSLVFSSRAFFFKLFGQTGIKFGIRNDIGIQFVCVFYYLLLSSLCHQFQMPYLSQT